MFKWINKQTVESDLGFILQFTGRFSAEYRENGRKMTLDIEFGSGAGGPCVIVERSSFKRWDNDSVPLSEEEQNRVINNFTSACEFQDLEVDI
ncbi:hypothetical protein CUZ56_00269 [Saezia sanguinis]|uniref:Uncharacterized protein n=1 Tax=Saezia sanguinis TaxID=1965230 RepID=A0A433SGF4_9BURK|nr:hypothetical protein [Saezia sanguinis]RUS67792.1 hypothetical protein CUZ56_00269 [Saezia sanguinis]